MMKKLLYLIPVLSIILAMTLPVALSAGDGKVLKVGDKVKFSKDIEGTYIGNDVITGKPKFKSTIEAPIYISDSSNTKTLCQWEYRGDNIFVSKDNLFYAEVQRDRVILNRGELEWQPTIEIGDSRDKAEYVSTSFWIDYINANYNGNVIRITYNYKGGVIYRDLRLIEGVLCEYYYFDKTPKGDVYITTNAKGNTARFSQPSAWDANNKQIKVDGNQGQKTLLLKDLKDAVYPVILEPSATYYTSASDGSVYAYDEVSYNTAWTQTSGDNAPDDSSTWTLLGQAVSYYTVQRSFLFFDTSGLPDDAIISTATISLYGEAISAGAPAWDITLVNGQPDYPHNPLTLADYNKANYSGSGGTFNTSGWSTSDYNVITLDATGRSWINKTSITKFTFRSSRDIAGTTPTGNELVGYWSYEKGAGYRPKLDITYTVSVPSLTTSAATSVACTTAQLNGEITNTGGENCNVRGFVWDTASHGDPGNTAPPATYSDNYTTDGDYSTGTFNYSGGTFVEDTTYYYRSVAHNSAGYAYGSEQTFETMGDPTITINNATNISITTARLNSYIDSGNGDTTCQVRWGWGTTNQADNITAYDDYTTYAGSYGTGNSPYYDVSSLVASTTYYFQCEVQNDCGTDTGVVHSFTTESSVGSPSDVTSVATYDTITLSWHKGTGATKTMVRYMENQCPTDNTTGTQIYLGTASTYEHIDLTSGSDYCYFVIGYDDAAGFSTNYVIYHATTLAGETSGNLFSTPSQPIGMYDEPTVIGFTNVNPLAPVLNAVADSIGMPQQWFWAALFLVLLGGGAYSAYHFTHEPMAAIAVIAIGAVFLGLSKILPYYIAAVMFIMSLGFLAMRLRKGG